MKNQKESKIKNSKLKLILIPLFILCSLATLLVGTLCYFSLKYAKNPSLNSDLIEEQNPPLISVIPKEKNEINIEPNIPEENIVENPEDSHSTDTAKPNTIPPTPTTPSPPTTPTTPATPTHIIKTETSTKLKTENKYGVIIKTYTTSTYDVYSDGTKKITSSSDRIEYDKTGYNATTAQLLPEAKKTKNQFSSTINQVFKNVNSYREEANSKSIDGISNRKSLILNENLCVAACVRVLEIGYSSKFTHTRPNGSKFYSIFDEMNIDYITAGENISYGYSDANSVSEGWKNSEGHYENMISSKFSQIGIGVFEIEGTYYWVQLFN